MQLKIDGKSSRGRYPSRRLDQIKPLKLEAIQAAQGREAWRISQSNRHMMMTPCSTQSSNTEHV